jgi:dTDP-4-dehydrorhamnose reductase
MDRVAWITGAGGLIGSHIVRPAPREWAVRALTRTGLDLTDFAAVRAAFERESPQLIIHCAALSSIAACNANPQLAWRTNLEGTKNLADLAANIPLLLFSTDLVFDGRKGNYSESDTVNPLSLYGETKVAAEQVVLANPKHLVIRTTLTAGASPRGDRSLDEQLRLTWKRGETTRLFVDEFRSPIPAEVTARAVWDLIGKNGAGLFHLGGSDRISRFELGRVVAACSPQLNPRIEPISIRELSEARRPPDTSLNSEKIQRMLSFPLPRISDWLRAQTTL